MRIIDSIFNIILSIVEFVLIESWNGVFTTLGSVFSLNTWASIPAKDIWIFFFFLALNTLLDNLDSIKKNH